MKTRNTKKFTKIITSIGQHTKTIDDYKKLLLSGSNVARINFSHGNGPDHLDKVKLVTQASKELNMTWGLLLDTKGPEIRTHCFENGEVKILADSKVEVYLQKEILGTSEKFSITYPDLWKDVKVGGIISVDDGFLQLQILEISEEKIITRAINERVIADRRGVNIPETAVKIKFLSEKDRNDIEWGCGQPFNYIALSFVQKKEDVLEVKEILKKHNREDIQIISKLESQGAVDNFHEILDVSDGIMVARGDLGVEVHFTKVPMLQKRWIREANKVGKPVVVATQMLESMINNPQPTRAEVSDVYNAIEDATSAVMLSGETAKGKFFKESTQTMNIIAHTSEENFDFARYFNRINRDGIVSKYNDLAKKVFRQTNENMINDIFVLEDNYDLVRFLARTKPQAEIHPLVKDINAGNKYTLLYGVYPIVVAQEISEKDISFFEKQLEKKYGTSKNNGYIVIKNDKIIKTLFWK